MRLGGFSLRRATRAIAATAEGSHACPTRSLTVTLCWCSALLSSAQLCSALLVLCWCSAMLWWCCGGAVVVLGSIHRSVWLAGSVYGADAVPVTSFWRLLRVPFSLVPKLPPRSLCLRPQLLQILSTQPRRLQQRSAGRECNRIAQNLEPQIQGSGWEYTESGL